MSLLHHQVFFFIKTVNSRFIQYPLHGNYNSQLKIRSRHQNYYHQKSYILLKITFLKNDFLTS